MRIGFLYFYHQYHVPHSAPTAFELSRLEPDWEVHLFSSSSPNTDLLATLSSLYPHHYCIIHPLSQPLSFRYLNIEGRCFPSPQRIIKKHASLLQEMDVIVGTTNGILGLFHESGITSPKFIQAFHGAGDRAYGFKHRLEQFHFLLLSGPKKYHRLKASGVVNKDNWAIVGYPKFDVAGEMPVPLPTLFPEKKTVVLYNPHFKRPISSWYTWGRKILEFFAGSPRYNLIFAPHVELKGRKQRWLTLRKYTTCPNIHIDLGSPASYNMTYTSLADIYLGDTSSQICEYLLQPRPCIFLNSQGISWEDNPNYLHWHLGPVVDQLEQLEAVLETAFQTHKRYLAAQVQYFNNSIELTDTPSGLRAARAIQAFLRGESRHP